MAEHSQQVSMSIEQRVNQCNLQPRLGSLTQMLASAALQQKFVKNLSASQKATYGIVYDSESKSYKCVIDEQKATRVAVTLTDTEVFYFRDFITWMSTRLAVSIDDAELYQSIIELSQSLEPQPQQQDEGE